MIKRNFHRRRSDGDCSSRVKDSRKSVSDRKIAREFLFGIRLEFNFFSFGSVIARELIFSSFRPFEFITIIIINYHHREVNFARRFERWRGEKREDSRRESQTLVARKRFPSYVIFQTCFRCFLRETLSNTTVPPPLATRGVDQKLFSNELWKRTWKNIFPISSLVSRVTRYSNIRKKRGEKAAIHLESIFQESTIRLFLL